MKRILNYPGSKWTLAENVITLFPDHTTYVEPFFGSGAVYFNKPVSKIETINDLNERVYNFFKVCRDHPNELASKILLTPHSRQELMLCDEIDQDPIEDARRFLINSWQSIGGIQRYKTGWRSNIDKLGGKLHEWNDLPERIMEVAGRLKQTQIENQDAIKLLERYNRHDVLAYIDPPYLMELRKCRYYKTEMESDQHKDLLELLRSYKGKVILSGYDSKLYDQFLKGWDKIFFKANAEGGQSRTEVIWCNFETQGQTKMELVL